MLFLLLALFNFQEPDYQKKLQELNSTYQNCLDEGQAMMDCSRDFYSEMGELMELILIDIQENSPLEYSDSIIQNQRVWEVKIEDKFNLINQRLDSVTPSRGAIPHDELMFAYNDKAQIIEERIVELIKVLDQQPKAKF